MLPLAHWKVHTYKYLQMLTEFVGNLACPLEFGHALVIVGKTIDGATRFYLNLRTGKEKTSDIGLHISVKFREDIILRNSQINGEWGDEEREDNLYENTTSNPIVQGDFFIICIFAGETQFHVSINNRPFCTFKYRIPVKDIRTFEIRDYIQAVKQVDHRAVFPYSWPPIQYTDPKKSFSNDIPILFTPGHVIVITARVYGNNRGNFIIKFTEADSKRELLHFNPRFEPHNVVVRNAMEKNFEFGMEERDGGFPFVFDQQFCLAIGFTDKKFLFAVDGRYFTSFSYRSQDLLEDLTGFKIVTNFGMKINVTRIDHMQVSDIDGKGLEIYSRDDIDIF